MGLCSSSRSRRWALRICVCIGWLTPACLPAIAAATQGDAQILYFEPLRLSVPVAQDGRQKTSARDIRKLELEAFGRQLTISVETNESFHDSIALKQSQSSLKLYRGEIEGVAGSWVRLATKGTDVHGMLWDGEEAFVIAPSDEIGHQLVPPLHSIGETVIFRLADVLIPSSSATCASSDAPEMQRASEAFAALRHEKQSASGGATQRIELAALADSKLLAQYADAQSARDSILLRLNIVDGIFSTQLGVQIQVPSVTVHTSQSDPFTGTTDGQTLLDELASVRRRTPTLREHGLTHLFTGRKLDGTTIGIGFIGSLCDSRYGAAVTEITSRGSWHEALVAAHEIGHNFGAVHDGQAGKACASTPQGVYLMSPNINGNDQFSQCSLGSMRWNIARASCIAPLPPANIGIASDLGSWQRQLDASFDWDLPIVNRGGAAAFSVRAELTLPASVMVESAAVDGGTCISGAGIVQCELGTIPGGASRSVNLQLRGESLGSQSIAAKVFAQGESASSLGDNEGAGTLVIAPLVDIALNARAPTQVRSGESFTASFTLTNSSASAAQDVRSLIELPAGFTIASATLADNACQIDSTAITCSLGTLPANASVAGAMTLSATQDGTVRMRSQGAYFDSNSANDSAELAIQISATLAAPARPASGGGGGTMALPLLLLLSGTLARRVARR